MYDQNLYAQLVEITSGLMGPASELFIARHIHNHLRKSPGDITKEDVNKLQEWLLLSMTHYTEDAPTLNTYATKLRALGR